MKIQVYDDDNVARVFDTSGNGICDLCPRAEGTLEEVDKALKRVRMRRTTDWKRYRSGGFYEATVRFESPRRTTPGKDTCKP